MWDEIIKELFRKAKILIAYKANKSVKNEKVC